MTLDLTQHTPAPYTGLEWHAVYWAEPGRYADIAVFVGFVVVLVVAIRTRRK